MTTFRKILTNTLYQSGGKFVVILFSVVTTYALTHWLGKSGYGDYTFLIALVLLLGNVADWGTNIIVIREASLHDTRRPLIFGSSTIFRLLLALLAFIISVFVVMINPAWDKLLVPALIASLVLFALSLKTSFGAIFQTHVRFDLNSLVEISSSFLFTIFVIFTLYNNLGLKGVMFSWFLSTLISSVLGYFLAKKLTLFEWVWDKKIIKKIFLEALPTGALFISFTIYNRVDTMILKYYQGSDAVAVYGLSYKIHDQLVLGAAFLMNASFPYLSKKFTKKDGLLSLKNHYQKTFDIFLGVVPFVFVSTYIAAPFIINLLGGSEFGESINILRVLIFATAFAYFNHLTGYSLIAFGKQRLSLIIAIAVLIFNIFANFMFIPVYSYKASAIITVATEGLVLLLSSFAVSRVLGMSLSFSSFPKTWYEILVKRTFRL